MRLLLQLQLHDDTRRPVVLEANGDALSEANKFEDAGLAYMAAGRLDKALKAYRCGCTAP